MNTFSEDRNCFLWVVNVVVLSISLVVLESVLWDAEGQMLSGSALVGFVVSEVKARTV